MFRVFSTSIVRQIVAMTLALLFISTAAIVSVTYYNLSAYVMRNAVADAKNASRAMSVLYGAAMPDAHIEIVDNRLTGVSEEKIPAFASHDLVDHVAQSIDGVATIFEKRDSDYVRVSTNVKTENGERAIGTKLAAEHPAQPALARGEAYYGPADLFGRKFMTGYFPMKNAAGNSVGILFIGIPMEVYYADMHDLQILVLGVGAAVMFVVCILAYLIIRRSVRPLEVLTGSVSRISNGELSADVPFVDRANEFGAIARALQIFVTMPMPDRRLS